MPYINERVLCVDDQPEIIELLKRQLRDTYDCIGTNSGAAALRLLDEQGPFAAVVADYSMPNMDGITLLAEIRKRAPDTVPIMLTAFDDLDVAIAALHHGNIFRFLRKPWDVDELIRAISDAFDQYQLVNNERRLREQLARANIKLDAKVTELDETNRLLEYWVEFSPAVLYSAGCEGNKIRPTYVSKNFARLCGYERTAMIVDPEFWYTNMHSDDVERARTSIKHLVDGQDEGITLEYRVRHKDGELRRVLDSVRVIRNPDGEALEIVGAWLDVTTRQP